MTHWQLDDTTPVEIVTFLDDHILRLVLSIRVFPTTTMENVRRLFHHTCDLYGTPASVLTDNGAIYNAGARGGRTAFESDLITAGVLYKHSRPYHPQTCGKVERWHRTLKKFLLKRPAHTLGELQVILEDVVRYYNDVRPHRGINRPTPAVVYNARAKAQPYTFNEQPALAHSQRRRRRAGLRLAALPRQDAPPQRRLVLSRSTDLSLRAR